VAVAATYGQPKVEHFFGDGLKDPAVLAAAKKVVPVLDHEFDWTSKLPKGRLDIKTVDGRSFSLVGGEVPGDAGCPMSWDYLYEKFKDTAKLAAIPPSVDTIRTVQEMIRNLEALDDATDMMRTLTA
jgi:2-methylcitrate dehydratase PrpD